MVISSISYFIPETFWLKSAPPVDSLVLLKRHVNCNNNHTISVDTQKDFKQSKKNFKFTEQSKAQQVSGPWHWKTFQGGSTRSWEREVHVYYSIRSWLRHKEKRRTCRTCWWVWAFWFHPRVLDVELNEQFPSLLVSLWCFCEYEWVCSSLLVFGMFDSVWGFSCSWCSS